MFGFLSSDCITGRMASDLEYVRRGNKPLRLDIHYPPTSPPAGGYPFIICIHGGGWVLGNKRRDLFLQSLLPRGYALASLDYRSSLRAKYPAQIDDAREAAHWLIEHAEELDLDAKRAGAYGPSAGGHLSLLLAFASGHALASSDAPILPAGTIRAVAALYAPTDLVSVIPKHRHGRFDNLVALLLGTPISKREDAAREASPTTYVTPASPPVHLVHGDRDGIVPVEQSRLLHRALCAQGVESTLIIREGGKHGFAPTDEMEEEIARFFERHLAPG